MSVEQKLKISLAKKGTYLGNKHPNWKGGKILDKSTGYYSIKCRAHPFARPNGYVLEHRLVMEKILGRYLKPSERVHHINRIKTDNRKENLELLSSQSEHVRKYHHPQGAKNFTS